MIVVSCGLHTQAILLQAIIALGALIGSVRLKNPPKQQKMELNDSMIIMRESPYLGPDYNGQSLPDNMADSWLNASSKQNTNGKSRAYLSQIFVRNSFNINDASSESDSNKSSMKAVPKEYTRRASYFKQYHFDARSLRANYGRNLGSNEMNPRTEIAKSSREKEEEASRRKRQVVETTTECKSTTVFDTSVMSEKSRDIVQAKNGSSRISSKLEKTHPLERSGMLVETVPPTMAVDHHRVYRVLDHLKPCTEKEEPHQQEHASILTASPGAPAPGAATLADTSSAKLMKTEARGSGGGRSDIKSRGARSPAPEELQEPQQQALHLQPSRMMTSIQSIVGQPLTIPCTNQTLAAYESALPPGQAASGHQHHWQHREPKADGSHSRLQQYGGSVNFRGGGARKPVANGQGISLIVWHKDDQLNSPIFAVDARGAASLREAKQQTGLESLKGRAHLEESTRVDARGFGSTPALVIDEATGEDGGVYTCTIEFYEAQTQTYQMRVLLINPPRNMIILDHLTDPEAAPPLGATQSILGPYDEESRLALACEVAQPGEPSAQVSWWQLMSTVLASGGNPRTSGRLELPPFIIRPGGSSSSSTIELLTTIALEKDNHDSLGDTATRPRDYFVALHSITAANATSVREPLPFNADGYRLRHWTRVKDQQVSSSSDSSSFSGGKAKSVMEITSLSRANMEEEFICLARNNDFSAPLNASVKLDLNLKPIEVKIMNKSNYAFKTGQKMIVECHVYGSRPAAKVRWFKGLLELDSSAITSSAPKNYSDEQQNYYISELARDINNNLTQISYLTLVPQLSDNQASLTCSANNPKLPKVPPLSDSMTMNVQFPAQMFLQFGSSIKQEQIKLGSDVFMDCVIKSNPPIDDLTWLFNGQPLSQNASAGIIMSNLSLVIQRIRIEHRGKYQCVGQNSFGKFHSNKLELKPKFKPVCDHSLTKTKYKVAVNQPAKIECNVLAEPSDDIDFYWQFNQTFGDPKNEDTIVVHPLEILKQYETNFTKSYVTFTPKSKRNYGQLLCSASNSMGKQDKPCVIQVIASELPEPVFSCFFDDFTNTSFNVHCQSSVQGASTRYLLELYTNESLSKESFYMNTMNPMNHLKQRQENQDTLDDEQALADIEQQPQQQVKRMTSDFPSFKVTDLKPETSYNVMIYVLNSKGRSVPYFHPASTLPADSGPDPLAFNGGSQIQFNNSRRPPPNESASISDRLIAYLRVSDYLNGNSSKPLLGVALIVLLCTITVVTITFFVVRMCRPPAGTDRLANRKRGRLRPGKGGGSRGFGAAAGQVKDAEKLRTYDGKEPQIDKDVQLNLATPSRLKALAGSGSDTSRETNTDSTLVSMFRPGHHEVSLDKSQQQHQTGSRRPSYGSTNNFSIQAATRELAQNYQPANFGPTPMVNMSPALFTEQQKLHSVYSSIKRSAVNSPRDLELHMSTTPQVSIQSGSDCTSNNELQGDVSEFHDQLLLKCQDSLSEPVYVIERDGQLTTPGQCVGSRQLRILTHPTAGFWPNYNEQISLGDKHNGSISGGTNAQVSSSAIADNYDQQTPNANLGVLNGVTGSTHELPLPISFLPNSVSIPVSLAAGECQHLAVGNYHHRRLSHEFLAQDLCFASPPVGPYLTLAPATDQSGRNLQRSHAHTTAEHNQQQKFHMV